jgi:hypothetical protein
MDHRRGLGLGLAIFALGGTAACGATRAAIRRPPPGHHATSAGARGPQAVSVGCASAVFSPGQSWPDRWPEPTTDAIVAGPIAWPDLRTLASDHRPHGGSPATAYAPVDGLAFQVEGLVALTDGTTARVQIPANESRRLSLDYTGLQPRNAAGRYNVSDGASRVTFHACSRLPNGPPSSLFEGGFIVAWAQCARVDVYTGTSRQPVARQIAFGVRGSTCRPTA